VAAVISKVRNGEPFTYSQAPLWLLHWIMPEIAIMGDWFNSTGYKVDIAAVRAIYPETMTFEQWLRKKGYDKKQLPSSSWCTIS
jgi:hypothetical protein